MTSTERTTPSHSLQSISGRPDPVRCACLFPCLCPPACRPLFPNQACPPSGSRFLSASLPSLFLGPPWAWLFRVRLGKQDSTGGPPVKDVRDENTSSPRT